MNRWIDVVAASAGVHVEDVATVVDALNHHGFVVVAGEAVDEGYFNSTPMDEQKSLASPVFEEERT